MKKSKDEIEFLKSIEELIVNIDMINGFVKKGELAAPSIKRVVPRQIELLNDAIESDGKAIAFVGDWHTNGSIELKRYAKHALQNTYEAEFIDELKSFIPFSLVYRKNSTNCIYVMQKDLLKMPNLKKVKLMGCLSDVCVTHGGLGFRTFFDEVNKDVEVGVYADAIDTFDAPGHNADLVNRNALENMEANGIKVLRKTR